MGNHAEDEGVDIVFVPLYNDAIGFILALTDPVDELLIRHLFHPAYTALPS
ncbi:hypothetical protein D3C73_1517120 [compost metagenome]